jgi:hypothetical protein
MQVAGPDANRRDILDGGFEDGILVACMAVISGGKSSLVTNDDPARG